MRDYLGDINQNLGTIVILRHLIKYVNHLRPTGAYKRP